MLEDDYVETSDAEEREELQAAENAYGKQVLHDDPTRSNDPSQLETQIEMDHGREPASSQPHTPVGTPTLEPAIHVSPMIRSSPLHFAPTPAQSNPDSRCEIWEDLFEHDEYEELSQDPLLLSPGMAMKYTSDADAPEISSSPVESQPSSTPSVPGEREDLSHVSLPRMDSSSSPGQQRSQSTDPLCLLSSPQKSILGSPIVKEDAHILHTPTINTNEAHLVSPLSPLSPFPPSLNEGSHITNPNSAPSGGSSPLHPSANRNAAIEPTDLTELDVMLNERRYPQRHRNAWQLQPYTVDQYQYKQALRSNPDAIVKFHSPTRAGRRRLDDGDGSNIWELQEQDFMEDGDHWEESRRKRAKTSDNRRSRSHDTSTALRGTESVQYPDFLQDLPSTDEEEAKALSALSKEARKAERERRAKAKLKRKNGVRSTREVTENSPSYSDGSRPFRERTGSLNATIPTIRSTTPTFMSGTREERTLSPIALDVEEPAVIGSHYDMDIDDLNSPMVDAHLHSAAESSESSESYVKLDRKRMKALQRMAPGSLVTKWTTVHSGEGARRQRRQRSLAISSDDTDVQLLPGQTRIRRAENPKEVWEIKGDSESSSDENSSVAEQDPEDTTLRPLSDGGPQKNIIDISDSSDGVDDEEIEMHLLSDKPQFSGRIHAAREESLIDWMLTKTRTIGMPSKTRTVRPPSERRKGKRPRFKYDVRTRESRGLGTGRQTTLLNFRHPSGEDPIPSPAGGFRPSRTSVPSFSSKDLKADNHGHNHNTNSGLMQDHDASKKKAKKSKAKERRKRAKTNGLYTFTSDTHAVIGGRGNVMAALNIEDEGFHTALAPPSQARTNPLRHANINRGSGLLAPLSLNEQLDSHPSSSSASNATVQPSSMKKPGVRHDMGESVLHSGLSFGSHTYIGRGWLHDLVESMSSPPGTTAPLTFTFRSSHLGPSTSVEKLCDSLRDLIDQFFDLACDLPEFDQEQPDKDPGMVAHLLCKLLSWFLTTCSVEDQKFITLTVQNHISRALARLREITGVDPVMDRSTLSLCWLIIELSARLGHPVRESVSWLVHKLLEYGFLQIMAAVQDDILDGSTTAHYAAELWVCVFYLLDSRSGIADPEEPRIHLFWTVVMEVLEPDKISEHALERSETLWQIIFGLCALMQFSVHGMTTTISKLPACWDFVIMALKMIRLTPNPEVDHRLTPGSLHKRDIYLSLMTLRCFFLWNRWHWSLDGAHSLFTPLLDIFKSRTFANLRHEAAEFPAFLLDGDWSLLSSYQQRNTAFELFLKLLFHAVTQAKEKQDKQKYSQVRKLLSLSIPVGSLPFSRDKVTLAQDLSVIFNRLGAVAIGIHLDPSHHPSMLQRARSYVDFAIVDDTTRVAVIRGTMTLGILMRRSSLPLRGIADWIKSMADLLVDEFKSIPKDITPTQPDQRIRKHRLMLCIQCLLRSASRITEAYKDTSEYPEPALLTSFIHLLTTPSLTSDEKTAKEVFGLASNFFSARAAALPPPARPPLAPVRTQEGPESQDEYGAMDFDFDDPALLAALGDDVDLSASPNYRSLEEALMKAIDDTHLHWLSWRRLTNLVTDPSQALLMKNRFEQIEHCLDCWLGCADVFIRYKGKEWAYYLDQIDAWGRADDSNRRRIDLAVMLRILQLDPMTYNKQNFDRYMAVLVEALVSRESEVESQFIVLLLSIDGFRHPLFQGVSYDLGSGHVSSVVDFPELRSQLINAFIANLDKSLRDEAAGDPTLREDNIKQIGFCIRMLSAMRSIYAELLEYETRQTYLQQCQQVLEVIDQYSEVRSHPRLNFLISWGRSLS